MSAHAANVSMKTSRGCGCKCGSSNGACGCGGGCSGSTCATQNDCPIQCCELECLVRPNFFCGQLLTDADLSAMVEWTRKRLALSRYRDGWGVVCGLDMTCGPPDGTSTSCCGDNTNSKGPFVWLTPGYAVDCCGNDLVVCDPLRIDLSSVCRPPYDPCNPNAVAPAQTVRPDAANRRGEDCFDLDLQDVFAVQVSLRYHEDLTQGQRAMFRSGGTCGDTAACEYARVLERPCVSLEVVPFPLKDDRSDEQKWMDGLRDGYKNQANLLLDVVKQGPDAVLKYLRTHPPYQFCYLAEIVCCLRATDPNAFSVESAVRLFFHLLVDWLLREMACGCGACKPDLGVPLGAILLRRSTTNSRTTCKVLMSEAGDSYRRTLKLDPCRPIPPGELDLLQYLGKMKDEVSSQLRAAGVHHDSEEQAIKSVDEVAATHAKNHLFSINPLERKSLRMLVVNDPFGVSRVVGFA